MDRQNLAELTHLTIIESPHLTETRVLTLAGWSRFRAWVEDLAARAGFSYPFPRVRRSETVPSSKVLVMGSRVFCHPATARQIRDAAKRGEG